MDNLRYEQIEAMQGDGGWWCQADAVYIDAKHQGDAVERYRSKVAKAEIGISSHLPCVSAAQLRKTLDDWRVRVALRLHPDVPGLQGIDEARALLGRIDDVDLLRLALLSAIDAHVCVTEWLGHASTQQAAYDSMHRFRRILWGLGLNPVGSTLDWRGSLIEALERAGFRASEDGDIRRVLPGQKGYEFAKGQTLAGFVASQQTPSSATTEHNRAIAHHLRSVAAQSPTEVRKVLTDLARQIEGGKIG